MSEVTQILWKIEMGQPQAAAELLPLIYDELRRLAAARMSQERIDHTLQATALVHEAFLRLVDTRQVQHWNSRGHFYAAAAEAMRRILIESAKSRQRLKRGGNAERLPIDEQQFEGPAAGDLELLELDDLITAFANHDPSAAELVKLHLFAGLTIEEAGAFLGMSRSVAYENWRYARAWFSMREELKA